MRRSLFPCVSKRTIQSFSNALFGVSRMSFSTERGSRILGLTGRLERTLRIRATEGSASKENQHPDTFNC